MKSVTDMLDGLYGTQEKPIDFKVGDRVRCTQPTIGYHGRTGEVKDISGPLVLWRDPSDGCEFCSYPKWLELECSAPASNDPLSLKVGERVRVVGATGRAISDGEGVLEYDDGSDVPYFVRFDNGYAFFYRKENVRGVAPPKLVDPQPPLCVGQRVGQRVRVHNRGGQCSQLFIGPYLGRIGVVTEVDGDSRRISFGDAMAEYWFGTGQLEPVANMHPVDRAIEAIRGVRGAGIFRAQYAAPGVYVRDLARETWSADLVLADGRSVTLPGPDPTRWELVEERPCAEVRQAWARSNDQVVIADPSGDVMNGETFPVRHDEGLCWLTDMARIVNETRRLSPFDVRYAHVTVLRHWQERPVVEERYSGCESILSCLW